MSAAGFLLAGWAVCCAALAAAQAAELDRWARLGLVVATGLALALAGDLASRTSVAQVGLWLGDPGRRLDLSALLLMEALLFGSQAAALAQGSPSVWWRLAGHVPPPSFLLALFFAQVAIMLAVDGVAYAPLSWACALAFMAALAGGARLARWLLPDTVMRSGLRLGLHAAQAAAGLWLARPAQSAAVGDIPAMAGRLAVLAAAVFLLALAGWLLQRRPIFRKGCKAWNN